MPSSAAAERGTAVAEAILDSHKKANGGDWPETVAVSLLSCCNFSLSLQICGLVLLHASIQGLKASPRLPKWGLKAFPKLPNMHTLV